MKCVIDTKNGNSIKMETGNLIIGGISAAAIILPFVFMYRKRKQLERELTKGLKSYAASKNLKIDQTEVAGNVILGIDHQNTVAFLGKKEKTEEIFRHVNLENIKLCKVNRQVREIVTHGKKDKVTHSLSLEFYPQHQQEEITRFSLYNEDSDEALGGEIQLANEWVRRF